MNVIFKNAICVKGHTNAKKMGRRRKGNGAASRRLPVEKIRKERRKKPRRKKKPILR
jgi:hypothetical protein